jgi:peptidoglycan/LPS O-acetylase OafA/YrhL
MNTAVEWSFPARPAAAARKPVYGHYRFLLALSVMAAHYGDNLAPLPLRTVLFPLGFGPIGVSGFFVLSGLIVAEAAERFYAERPLPFLANRMLRLVPPLVFSIVLAFAVWSVLAVLGPVVPLDGGHLRPITIAPPRPADILWSTLNLFPLPARWRPVPSIDLQPVIWSLRVEMLFYATMAIGLTITALVRSRFSAISANRAWSLFLLAAGIVVAFAFLAWSIGAAPDTAGTLPFFALGVSLHIGRRAPLAGLVGVAVFTPMALYNFATAQLADRAVWRLDADPITLDPLAPTLLLTAVLLVLMVLILRPPPIPRRLDRWLGDLTYPLYLNHVTAGVATATLIGRGVGAVVVATAGAVALAWIATTVVDGTVKQWRDRLRGRAIEEIG